MFTTSVEIPPSSVDIDHKSQILTLGSCFSENIGKKLQNAFFNIDVNPFGVLYNPLSIQNSLRLLLDDKEFTEKDIFRHASLWHSFSHDSSFSHIDADTTLKAINSRLRQASVNLSKADFLLITFGTAWVFEQANGGNVVSNCHKLPAAEFRRRRLTLDEIVNNYNDLIQTLQTSFPNLRIVFSVSPIRHWKDGAHENNISKATLLLAIDELTRKYSNIDYFPAYEIVMDELRDYRFYASDMLHPSETAVDYIWKRFGETYFSPETQALQKRLEQLSADLAHRALHPETEEYQSFLKNTEKRRSEIIRDYPFMADRIK